MVLTWAVHRLNGICAPISAGASPADVEKQLTASRGKVLFTHSALLPKAVQAAKAAGIPDDHIYLLDSPSSNGVTNGATHTPKSVNDLVSDGLNEPSLEALTWQPGQGAKQVAFLCFSSGTSGPPVMSIHLNCNFELYAHNQVERSHDHASQHDFKRHAGLCL
jgi:long-subunit acyl-CoA synthetase (AMP-forming)